MALALLGDASAADALGSFLDEVPEDRKQEVFSHIYFLTGRNYDISETTPAARLSEAIEQYKAWLETEGTNWEPLRRAILRRRAEGIPQVDLPVGTLRGALKATKQFEDFDRRWAGRKYLQELGSSAAPELRQIVEDPLEDLDVRRAAMEWYSAADPKAAQKILKDLAKKDENKVIRSQAERLLGEIDDYLD